MRFNIILYKHYHTEWVTSVSRFNFTVYLKRRPDDRRSASHSHSARVCTYYAILVRQLTKVYVNYFIFIPRSDSNQAVI